MHGRRRRHGQKSMRKEPSPEDYSTSTAPSIASAFAGERGPSSKPFVTLEQRRARPPKPAPLEVGTLLSIGTSLLVISVALGVIGLTLTLVPPGVTSNSPLFNAILADEHYKHLVPLLIPAGLVTIIVNWGGLHFFRHA